MERYGTTAEQFAKIGGKNHKHSVNNPYSQFQDEYSLDEIMAAPMVYEPLTKLQCCPTSDGAGAAILRQRGLRREARPRRTQAVEIAGMAMTTDLPSTLRREELHQAGRLGHDAQGGARRSTSRAGLGPENVDVIELHDCFSAQRAHHLRRRSASAARARAASSIDSGAVTYGGKWVVNPSGGLISKGHPLGATGLAQCAELNWQLRGEADKRQVEGAKVALQHNLGLGGAAVVTMYRKPERA